MNEVTDNFGAFLQSHGVIDVDEIIAEEKVRVAVEGDRGDQKSGAYKLFMNKDNGVPSGFVNNYRTGVYEKWSGQSIQGSKPIPIKEIQKRKAEQRRAKDALQHTKFQEFKKEFDSMEKASPLHPYAVEKGLRTSFFLRNDVRQDDKRNLVFPIKNKQGKITNLQRVWATGNKQLEKNGVLAGSFVKIGGAKETEFVLVTEGISTGATVNDITGIETYASLTGNNLSKVVAAVKELHPNKTIVIAGDNDFHLELRDPPLKNSGLINAEKAAKEVGGTAIFPPFNMTELSAGQTDWNDYNKEKGFLKTRDALRTAFKKIIDASKEVEPVKKYEVEL
jgi:phage/plasmid primase-like uncharacterized protein